MPIFALIAGITGEPRLTVASAVAFETTVTGAVSVARSFCAIARALRTTAQAIPAFLAAITELSAPAFVTSAGPIALKAVAAGTSSIADQAIGAHRAASLAFGAVAVGSAFRAGLTAITVVAFADSSTEFTAGLAQPVARADLGVAAELAVFVHRPPGASAAGRAAVSRGTGCAIAAGKAGEARAAAVASPAVVTDSAAVADVQVAAGALFFAVFSVVAVCTFIAAAPFKSGAARARAISGKPIPAGAVPAANVVHPTRAFGAALGSVKPWRTVITLISSKAGITLAHHFGVNHGTFGVIATAPVVFAQVSPRVVITSRAEQGDPKKQSRKQSPALRQASDEDLKIAANDGELPLHVKLLQHSGRLGRKRRRSKVTSPARDKRPR